MFDRHADATDAALVEAIASGDETALSTCFRRHGPAVISIGKRLLGDRQLAEDLAQEIFVRLWNRPERFDPARGKLRTLLLTQAHGLSVDTIRSRNARQRREERQSAETATELDNIDAELIALQDAENVRAALASLPGDERQPIEMAYFGANTYREVASLLGIPEGTVKTRIRSGLKRLHLMLSEDANGALQSLDHHAGGPPENHLVAASDLGNERMAAPSTQGPPTPGPPTPGPPTPGPPTPGPPTQPPPTATLPATTSEAPNRREEDSR